MAPIENSSPRASNSDTELYTRWKPYLDRAVAEVEAEEIEDEYFEFLGRYF